MGPDKTAEESEATEAENQKKLRRQFYVVGELQILAEKLNVSTPSTGCRAVLRKCVERIVLARQTSGRLGVLVEECVQLCMRPCGASSLVLALISDLCHASSAACPLRLLCALPHESVINRGSAPRFMTL